MMCLAAAPDPPKPSPYPQAFLSIDPAPAPPEALRIAPVRRWRAVTLNSALFDATARMRRRGQPVTVEMNFFPDVSIIVRWKPSDTISAGGGITWTGSIPGSRYGHAVLFYQPGAIVANVARGDGLIYQVRTFDSTLWVRELDQKRFPEEVDRFPR